MSANEKTHEELRQIIQDNQYVLPADSNARFVFLDKEQDVIVVELNVMVASPEVHYASGEVINPHYQTLRHAVRLRLRFSDLFMMGQDGQPPEKDLIYTFDRLEAVSSTSIAVREALEDLLRRYGHCASCCAPNVEGRMQVLPDTCCCSPEVKRAWAALAETAEEKAAWLGPRREFDPSEQGR